MNSKDFYALLTKELIKNQKGTYLLVLKLHKNKMISVGKLGKQKFEKGIYFYVGSAKVGYTKRVLRYFGGIKKKKWHIDYLIEETEPLGIFFMNNYPKEEIFAKEMEKLYEIPVKKFGSSDTKATSHLFYTKN